MDASLLLAFVLGCATGFAARWLMVRAEKNRLREQVRNDGAQDRARLEERLRNSEEQARGWQARAEDLQSTNSQIEKQAAGLAAQMKSEQKAAEEKARLLEEAKEKLSEAFKALASEALGANNQRFLELATTKLAEFQEGAKGDLAQRQQAVEALVKPIGESLGRVDAAVREVEQKRAMDYGNLSQQVQALATAGTELKTETTRLVQALRRPTVRGRWGEMQLRRVVEIAGMLGCV